MLARLDRFLFDTYSTNAESLAFCRILYALCLLSTVLPAYLWISEYPDGFFSPPYGLTYFFAVGFPPRWFFVCLNVILIGAAVLLLFGRAVTAASLAAAGALLVGDGWAYSFGKIDHDIFAIITPLALVVAGWGRQRVRVWPLALLALMIGLGMMTAGWAKAMSGWLDPSTQAARSHLLVNIMTAGRHGVMPEAALGLRLPAAWEALDMSTVAIECAVLFAIVNRRAFAAACALMCLFHFGVALLFQITFTPNLVAYAAFIDWRPRVTRGPVAHSLRWLSTRTRAECVTAIVGAIAMLLLIGNPILGASRGLGYDREYLGGLVFATAAAWIAASHLMALARSRMSGSARSAAAPGSSRAPDETAESYSPIILFDGACGVCNTWVNAVLVRDKRAQYRFAPLQSAIGQRTLAAAGLPEDYAESIVLVDRDGVHLGSTAAARVARGVGGIWWLAGTLGLLCPRTIRDVVYQLVAAHRHSWFGRRDTCRVPTADERSRFI
jgi:predicted DCC family thiol-disulfide oxidoreductase YuxK